MPETLIPNLYIFLLATFIGFEVIRRVSPLLHTPLMSLTNAISAIAIVGALVIAGRADAPPLVTTLGTIAVAASMINIVGGYLITYRMLKMFRKREPVRAPGSADSGAAGSTTAGGGVK